MILRCASPIHSNLVMRDMGIWSPIGMMALCGGSKLEIAQAGAPSRSRVCSARSRGSARDRQIDGSKRGDKRGRILLAAVFETVQAAYRDSSRVELRNFCSGPSRQGQAGPFAPVGDISSSRTMLQRSRRFGVLAPCCRLSTGHPGSRSYCSGNAMTTKPGRDFDLDPSPDSVTLD